MPTSLTFGDSRVELTNLDKVLYPLTGTTKADVIDYYVGIGSAMLGHIAGRPVTRKRWPNGVDHPAFFEKNLAAHAPSWLDRRTIRHKSRETRYPVVDTLAGLAWLGQQAALEAHVPQWRFVGDAVGPATRLVFDLDPGEGVGLPECAEVAVAVRDTVAQVGLRAYPVTSGSKGIHVYVPLDRELYSDGAATVARQVATNLEQLHPALVTATMAKSARIGKVFLDWSQNNAAKTTIAPYSLRGRPHPTVAAPRTWAEIEDPARLRQLEFDEVLVRVRRDGDLLAAVDPPVEPAGRVPDALATYRAMRDPDRTPEPVPAAAPTPGSDDRFVIQEHHARRLHYDLRLERDGVLVSWAVPKGLPESGTRNRLAVRTEDHPLEYLTFHGSIPRGEYGGGAMTIWDTGVYETEKWRLAEGEVIVHLRGDRVAGRYALIRTDGKNWLVHRMSAPVGAAELPRGLAPMLATPGSIVDLPADEWSFEAKWDGYRLIVEVDRGELTLRSRAGNVVTERYPALRELAFALAEHRVVLDGEVVVHDERGRPDFGRLQTDGSHARFLAFDVLYLDGTSLLGKRYRDRRRVLEALADAVPALAVPPRLTGTGAEAVAASRAAGWEGVIGKRDDSVYLPGKRGPAWLKQKHWRSQDVVIGGWRRGRGARAGTLGALLVGVPDENALRFVGRVGTGFTDAMLTDLTRRLAPLRRSTSPFADELPAADRTDAVWVDPVLRGEARFAEWTSSGRLRHPSWRGLRDDQPNAR